jgi:hypothetical protein
VSAVISQVLGKYMLRSDVGSFVKYEVYMRDEEIVAQVTVYRDILNFGVEVYDFLTLTTSVDVISEIKKHFESNFK